MCIICNMTSMEGVVEANVFLLEFDQARKRMKKAATSLLAVREQISDPEQRKQYDRAHKRMVRILRDWNSIEHQRECKESKEAE